MVFDTNKWDRKGGKMEYFVGNEEYLYTENHFELTTPLKWVKVKKLKIWSYLDRVTTVSFTERSVNYILRY